MNEGAPVIELVRATKRFGPFEAVKDIDLKVNQGEVVGFVGANGAGKTTTISLLLGFLGVSEGNVRLFGNEVRPATAHRSHRRIGYAAGDMELPAQLTGRQYLAFLRHQGKSGDAEQYQALLDRFTPQLDKKIRTLSRGNKQKIALVAAFMGDPELVILDEPTSGLDPVMQETFLDLVREYRRDGRTVFMSSHYLQEVMDVCSRVIMMHQGKVVQDASTSELLALGGKHVTVRTTSKATKPLPGAESVETNVQDDVLTLRFVFKGDPKELQKWLALVKGLEDLEVSEYNLEEAFRSMYQPEVTS